MRKGIKLVVIVVSSILLCAILVSAITNFVVISSSRSNLFDESGEIPRVDAIVVLGAGLRSDGTPSDMLSDRLSVAIKLYEKGVSDKIILSGDCSGDHYDEVGSMLEYCLDRGVPADSIIRDDTGFSTYESMYNVVEKLQYKNFVVVTQKYHLYRAVYIAKGMNADVFGVNSDPREYRGQIFRSLREYVARVKDAFKVAFLK